MDFTFLLTSIAIFIALYQVLPRIRREAFIHKFSKIELIVVLVFIGLILLNILISGYYDQISNNTITGIYTNSSINLNQITTNLYERDGFGLPYIFNVVSIILSLCLVLFVIYLLIFRKTIYLNKSLYQKLTESFNNNNFEDTILYLKIILTSLSKSKNVELKQKFESKIEEIFSVEEFVQFLCKNDQSFALELFKSHYPSNKELFWTHYGKALIQTKGSILYREFHEEFRGKPEFTDYLLNNVKISQRLNIWKPIGEAIIDEIDNNRRKEIDMDNFYNYKYYETRYNSPIYIGTMFFKKMVDNALANKVNWHMWLFYFDHIVDHICENISYPEKGSGEFWNMYEYYVYEIFSTYSSWIEYNIHQHNNSKKYTVALQNTNSENENGNIIKSAIISYTRSLRKISESKFRPGFTQDRRNQYLNTLFTLKNQADNESKKYAEVMLSCIKTEYEGYSSKKRTKFLKLLKDALIYSRQGGFDFVPFLNHNFKDEFEQFLNSLDK
jgi:hypothetical protein